MGPQEQLLVEVEECWVISSTLVLVVIVIAGVCGLNRHY